MSKWKETIGQGFGAPRKWGQSERKPVTDERDGSIAGHHIEHWDDSQDAVVNLKPINLKASTQGVED